MLFCTNKQCYYAWLSGLFSAPAIMHFLRIIFGFNVTVGSFVLPMFYSWVIFAVALFLAVFFCYKCSKSCNG